MALINKSFLGTALAITTFGVYALGVDYYQDSFDLSNLKNLRKQNSELLEKIKYFEEKVNASRDEFVKKNYLDSARVVARKLDRVQDSLRILDWEEKRIKKKAFYS